MKPSRVLTVDMEMEPELRVLARIRIWSGVRAVLVVRNSSSATPWSVVITMKKGVGVADVRGKLMRLTESKGIKVIGYRVSTE